MLTHFKTPFAKPICALVAICALFYGACSSCFAYTSDADSGKFTDKWAVVVGVGDFTEPGWTIKYATKDATDFKSYLIGRAKFRSDHVKALIGTVANRAKFLQGIDWLGAVSKPRDLALIFIRSRGTYADLNASGKNYLALSGTTAHSTAETAVEMRGFVDMVLRKVHSKAIAIIVDTDFGGNVLPSVHDLPDESVFPSGHTLVVVCSSDVAQICWESDRLKNSVFTYSLLQALSEPGTGGALLQAASRVADRVPVEVEKIKPNRTQYLECTGFARDSTSVDINLAQPPTHPRPAPASNPP